MDIQIKVPVKPYIKNYLLSVYHQESRRGTALVLELRSSCMILDKLYDLLSRPTRQAGKQLQTLKSTQEYTDTISVRLKSWPTAVQGLHLSEEKIHHFNVFVDKLIRDRLFTQLDTLLSLMGFECYPEEVHRCELPIDIRQVILRYMDYHDLEEGGMKYETLKKAYFRFRKDRKARLGGALSVPYFHGHQRAVLQNSTVAA